MTKPESAALWRAFFCLALIVVGLMLNACTYVKTDSLTVIDFHPVGGSTTIDATKTPEGMTLKANRNQGSAEGIVDSVAGAFSVNPLD
jgi:hypothetical protein